MRAFKTALAVFICMIVASLVSVLSPFFMSLAAIITMQVSTSDSLKMGQSRIVGTLVGAIIGLGFVLIQPENVILSAVGVWVIILIMNRLHWNTSIQISTFVFLAIMVNMNGQDPVIYSASRFIDTVIGVVIGVIVNYFVFPYNNLKRIQEMTEALFDLTKTAMAPHFEIDLSRKKPELIEELSEIRGRVLSLRDELNLYRSEAQVKKTDRDGVEPYEKQFELLWDIFEHMKHLNLLSDAIAEADKDNDWQTDEGANVPLAELYIVYRYHLNQIEMDLKTKEDVT